MSEIKTFKSGRLDEANAQTPLVLFLHGYGADERDLPDLMSFLPDLPWASLRAPELSQYGGYAWFPIETPLDPTPALVEPATKAIWDWVDSFVAPGTRLIVIGFSQGGLMATQLLRTRPERIQGAVILAGFLMNHPQPADDSLTKTKPKVIYCRGLQDSIVSGEAVARLNTWLQTHTKAITRTYDGLGHSIDQRVMNDVADYFSLVNS